MCKFLRLRRVAFCTLTLPPRLRIRHLLCGSNALAGSLEMPQALPAACSAATSTLLSVLCYSNGSHNFWIMQLYAVFFRVFFLYFALVISLAWQYINLSLKWAQKADDNLARKSLLLLPVLVAVVAAAAVVVVAVVVAAKCRLLFLQLVMSCVIAWLVFNCMIYGQCAFFRAHCTKHSL